MRWSTRSWWLPYVAICLANSELIERGLPGRVGANATGAADGQRYGATRWLGHGAPPGFWPGGRTRGSRDDAGGGPFAPAPPWCPPCWRYRLVRCSGKISLKYVVLDIFLYGFA